LEWRANPEKAIKVDEPLAQIIAGEGVFDGELSRFGHGLQRCYLLALLQELSGNDDAAGPKLILGCEEPELHQHPPQARHLADVLYRLSTRNSQVIVSTHSPYFVSGERFQDVRLIRKSATSAVSVSQISPEKLSETIARARNEKPVVQSAMILKMQQALLPGLNELFFTRVPVLVEGVEDVAYLTVYINMLDLWQEFRRLGCHIVPADGKSHMPQPLAIAKHLGIPTFVMFDSDADIADNGSGNRTCHQKDNAAILAIRGYESQDAMPTNCFWADDLVMWKSNIGAIVREEIGQKWTVVVERARAQFGHAGGLDKSSLFISAALAIAWEEGLKSASLERVCLAILDFARKETGQPRTTLAPEADAKKPWAQKKPYLPKEQEDLPMPAKQAGKQAQTRS
jgi:hypothetical protein